MKITGLRRPTRRSTFQSLRSPLGAGTEDGQAMVEFILILPLLLVLLLGVVDFGRVFAAGISMEAAARNGAEAAAQEYVQIVRNSGSLTTSDYQYLHELAIDTVCHEASVLPGYLA